MAKKKDFTPFKNEADCIHIGEDLTIENRVDRVSVFGSLDITLDQEGLKVAKELKQLLDLILAEMATAVLPDKIAVIPPKIVDNPFE